MDIKIPLYIMVITAVLYLRFGLFLYTHNAHTIMKLHDSLSTKINFTLQTFFNVLLHSDFTPPQLHPTQYRNVKTPTTFKITNY